MYPVRGKTALITGAGSGINLCFAKLLVQNGCNVVIADINLRPEAHDFVERNSTSPKVLFIKTDVADWDQIQRAFDTAEENFGEIDIVCPGAGIFEPPHSAFWFPPGAPPSTDVLTESRYESIDVNLVHPIRMTQLAINHFLKKDASSAKERRKKHILLLTSIAGHMPVFVGPLYSVTKHGISALVQSLAPLDDQLNIRVVGIAPGITATPIWFESKDGKTALFDDAADEWVLPEDVATVMLALVERDNTTENIGEEANQDNNPISIEGGTILEVSKTVRKISVFNDPGPVGRPGNTLGNMTKVEQGILQMLSGSTSS